MVHRRPLLNLDSELLDAIEHDDVVVPSDVLRSEMVYCYRQYQRAQQKQVWNYGNIFAYEAWIRSRYGDLQWAYPEKYPKVIINRSQLELLMIKSAPNVDLERHVALAIDAWRVAWVWDLWPVWSDVRATENGRECARWFAKLRTELDELNLITVPEVEHLVRDAIRNDELTAKSTVFYHINQPTRLQRQIMANLEEKKPKIRLFDSRLDDVAPHGNVVKFENSKTELATVAMWAREKMSELPEGACIGIAVPNVSEVAHQFKRQFENTFYELDVIDDVLYRRSPRSVRTTRHYTDLVTFLKWSCGSLHFSALKSLYRSALFPHLNVPAIFPEREGWPADISFSFYARKCSEQNLIAIRREISSLSRRRELLSVLIDRWIRIMNLAGWEEKEPEHSAYPMQRAISTVLDQVSTNAGILGPIRWRDCVRLILDLFDSATFSEGDPNAPVHLVSYEESQHLRFDVLWIMGMSDHEWPILHLPNPLIPSDMQRKANVTFATPNESETAARELMTQWFSACDEITFSLSTDDPDVECEPSGLIRELIPASNDETPDIGEDTIRHKDAAKFSHPWHQTTTIPALVEYANHQLSTLSKGEVLARTRLLQDISECQFRAQMRYRFGIDTPDEPATLITPLIKGSLFHELMQILCPAGISRDDILRLTDVDIQQAIDKVLLSKSRRTLRHLPKRIDDIERSRLTAQATKYIAFISAGDDFKVIAAESEKTVEIDGVVFSIRVDKVVKYDELGVLVFDYKSGDKSPNLWRLKNFKTPGYAAEAQMPLYAIAVPESTGLVYEIIPSNPSKNVVQKGLTAAMPSEQRREQFFEGTENPDASFATKFNELRQHWNQEFTHLLSRYRQGNATATPSNNVCRYCDLKDLCRKYDSYAVNTP